MEKRTLIAIALALLVVILYPVIIAKLFPQAVVQRSQIEKAVPVLQPQVPINKEVITKTTPNLATEQKTSYSTERLDLIFSDLGGCIKEISLKRLPSISKSVKMEYALFPQEASFGIIDVNPTISAATQPYTLTRDGNKIVFTAVFDEKIEITKTYIFHNDKYYIDFEIALKNISSLPMDVGYTLNAGSLIAPNPEEARFLEAVSKINSKIIKDTTRSVRSGFLAKQGPTDWVGVKNKYFSLILKPKFTATGSYLRLVGSNGLCASVITSPQTIPANTAVVHQFVLYAGPTDHLKMAELGISDAAGFGMLYTIGCGLIGILKFFFIIVRNWGVAIILLTVLVNLLLFPLTRKSYKSMQQMQLLQPQIAKLQKELKGNPQKLNKDIMELYKKHKVNPFGGCLPMLLQMPIFIALYQTLSRSIELKGAKFLWIKDLSEPDRAVVFNSSIPIIGDAINLLPLLMMLAMFLQQKIATPKSSDDQQAMMMKIIPFVFGLFFYSLPSGLVLYWLVQTVLMGAYQYKLMHSKTTLISA